MDIERKGISLELKDEQEGAFLARIATLNVIDHDGDVTFPGSFPKSAEVIVGAYQHGSWTGVLPVGKATLTETETDVVAEGQFNLNTTSGRDHYEAVKFSDRLQEWSYGFRVLSVGSEKDVEKWASAHEGARPYRIIKKLEPYEISPVLKGAGIATQTLAVKSQTFAEEVEAALAAVEATCERTKALAALRRNEGRDLSPERWDQVDALFAKLDELKAVIDAERYDPTEAQRAFMEFCRINATIMEVV